MILRVPDYYQEFSCIADKCKDSCCIGWEIDIDEDTYEFYQGVEGEMGERLQKHMYLTPEGEHSFELKAHGRCPFLNDTNLCDLCIAFGEEALSEVCTEYPRFAIEYGNVLQKCLSLSCEEVGRILFTREDSIRIVDIPYGEISNMDESYYDPYEELSVDDMGDTDDPCTHEPDRIEGEAVGQCDVMGDMEVAYEDDEEIIEFLEEAQLQAIHILQNQDKHIKERMEEYLYYVRYIQTQINYYNISEENKEDNQKLCADILGDSKVKKDDSIVLFDLTSYDFYQKRFQIFDQMETLDEEWENAKKELKTIITRDNYEELYSDYINSESCKELDYEQLMVYFTFRYFMNGVYDFDLLSYAKLAVVCTLMIGDLDIVRFHRNNGSFTREDRIDVVRIFSKEVEHSEENVELAREELMMPTFASCFLQV